MSAIRWIWQGALALVGCIAGAYVGQEMLGSGALGWIATGAIVAATCAPLLQSLLRYRQQRDGRNIR